MRSDSRPERGEVKAVVVDSDGTLADDSRRVDLEAISALRRVTDSGIPVMLASGNVLPIVYSLATYMGLDGPMIAENGGIVCHKQRIWVLGDPGESRRALRHLEDKVPVERLFTDRWRETEIGLKEDGTNLEEVRRLLEGFDVDVQRTGWALHIMARGMDKFTGVRKGCEILGLSTDEVASIGDSDNDSAMLGGCGWGVAVGNASDVCRSAATHTVEAGSGRGVVQALEWLRLA
jgi:phosphoglycolate phosphatase (TIGR01487 family)